MRLLRAGSLALVPLIFILGLSVAPVPSNAAVSVGISVGFAPPPLPVYEQPPIPGPGYLWTPGYWAWGPYGYYWVPGTWVLPPAIGLLWTPPWWGWVDGAYVFNAGYWGPVVGFYGGIDYGFGYFGHGYDGGYWNGGRFFYNREVNNIRSANITNVYSRAVSTTGSANRVSFNGGTGGTTARPTAQEQAAMGGHHVAATGAQLRQLNAARSNRALAATTNHGDPPIKATSQAGRFNSLGSTTTRGATRQSTIQSNPRTAQGTVANTRTTQRTLGTGARPSRSFGQASTGNVTRSAPGRFGQASPRSYARVAPHNFTQASPRTFGRSAPRTFGPAASRNFSPHGPSMLRPSNGPRLGGQRAVSPGGHPAPRGGGGAPQQRHGQ